MFDLVIAGSPRTGGNWLLRLLNQRGLPLGGEWLHPGNASAMQEAHRLAHNKHLPYVIKMHSNELWEYNIKLENVTDRSRPVKYIHQYRINVYDQAESWVGARASGKWMTGSTRGIVKPEPYHLSALIEMNDYWVNNLPEDRYRLTYESLVDDTKRELDHIMQWLGYNETYGNK